VDSAAVINLHDISAPGFSFSGTARTESPSVAKVKTRCSTCNLREICLPCGIQAGSSAFNRTDQGYPAASHTLVSTLSSSCP